MTSTFQHMIQKPGRHCLLYRTARHRPVAGRQRPTGEKGWGNSGPVTRASLHSSPTTVFLKMAQCDSRLIKTSLNNASYKTIAPLPSAPQPTPPPHTLKNSKTKSFLCRIVKGPLCQSGVKSPTTWRYRCTEMVFTSWEPALPRLTMQRTGPCSPPSVTSWTSGSRSGQLSAPW